MRLKRGRIRTTRSIPSPSEERLAEVLGLAKIRHTQDEYVGSFRRCVLENPKMISAYHLWRSDKSRQDYSERLSLSLPFFDVRKVLSKFGAQDTGISEAKLRIQEIMGKRPEEVEEVYDAVVWLLEEGNRPSRIVYSQMVEAYVALVRELDEVSRIGFFLEKHILPEFGDRNYLDRRDIDTILLGIPAGETVLLDPLLRRWLREGVTRSELNSFRAQVHRDRFRRELHKKIKEYAAGLGLDETQVMANIVFAFQNKTRMIIDLVRKEIELIAGILTIPLEQDIIDHESARGLLKVKLEDPGNGSSEYISYITNPPASHRDDLRLLGDIHEGLSEVPARYDFETFRIEHRVAVFRLRMEIKIKELLEKPDCEVRLEELVKYLNSKIKTTQPQFDS